MEEESRAAKKPKKQHQEKRETRVKPEPVSSGSTGGRKGMSEGLRKTGLSGEVEVLQLDSDEDEKEAAAKEEQRQVKRRKTAGSATSKTGVGGPKLGVMEIDSD